MVPVCKHCTTPYEWVTRSINHFTINWAKFDPDNPVCEFDFEIGIACPYSTEITNKYFLCPNPRCNYATDEETLVKELREGLVKLV